MDAFAHRQLGRENWIAHRAYGAKDSGRQTASADGLSLVSRFDSSRHQVLARASGSSVREGAAYGSDRISACEVDSKNWPGRAIAGSPATIAAVATARESARAGVLPVGKNTMLEQPTLFKLEAMRLHGMAQALREQSKDDNAKQLSFDERFALLIDRQLTWRQNEAMQARLRRAKLRNNACVEDIDYRAARGLDKTLVRSLVAESEWIAKHENVFVCGPTGVGKS